MKDLKKEIEIRDELCNQSFLKGELYKQDGHGYGESYTTVTDNIVEYILNRDTQTRLDERKKTLEEVNKLFRKSQAEVNKYHMETSNSFTVDDYEDMLEEKFISKLLKEGNEKVVS